MIEPGTDFWVVDAPHGFDLPSTLHDDYLEFHWLSKLNDCWGADLMVTPGWHSDYHNSNGSQAFRVEAHAVLVYTWSPQLKIALARRTGADSMRTSSRPAASFGRPMKTRDSN